jgi:hypothetical protein
MQREQQDDFDDTVPAWHLVEDHGGRASAPSPLGELAIAHTDAAVELGRHVLGHAVLDAAVTIACGVHAAGLRGGGQAVDGPSFGL